MNRRPIIAIGAILLSIAILPWSSPPADAAEGDTCTGRAEYCVGEICTPCGCHNQSLCESLPVCDPGYRVAGIWPIFLCTYMGYSPEPDIESNVIVTPQEAGKEVWGWANVHEHQFANLAYGGAMFWGAPFSDSDSSDENDINEALAWCDWTNEFKTEGIFDSEDILGRGWGIHGDENIASQSIFALTNNISTNTFPTPHPVGGTGAFDGWPTYLQGGHQQMYYKWLERAYVGGLRLMVNLAVNNEVLCLLSYRRIGEDGEPWPCHDMNDPEQQEAGVISTVDRQIDGMYALQDYIDGMCEGEECGWYRIATSASQARKIIEDGKMAVIIGIEVDSLFGCKPDSDFCTDEYIRTEIARYKDKGVRYIFPMHGFDNKFGGADLYKDVFAYANYVSTGSQLKSWDCYDHNYRWKLRPLDFDSPTDLLGVLFYPILFFDGDFPAWLETTLLQRANCNAKGLTAEGITLIEELISEDMIIDIDHISTRALHGYGKGVNGDWGDTEHKGVFDIVERQVRPEGEYHYPVTSGHAGVYDQDRPETFSEGSLKLSEAEKILELGGLVSLASPHGSCKQSWDFIEPGDNLGYLEMLDLMPDRDYPRTSLISDFGSFNPQVAPRFKLEGDCSYDGYKNDQCVYKDFGCEDSNTNPIDTVLNYPFKAFGDDEGWFWTQRTGDRFFDFNTQGLAHVGLYPDFLADLENVGLTREELEPLFGSAEGFLSMWEQIENCTPDGDAPVPDAESLPTITGECSAAVTDVPTASDFCEGEIVGVAEVTEFSDQGEHTVTWTFDDGNGNVATQTQTVIVDDVTFPTIDSLVANPNQLWPVNHKMVPVTITTVATDNCDPTPWCRLTAVTSNEPDVFSDHLFIGDLVVDLRAERLGTGVGRVYTNEVTCTDYAGNSTLDSVDVVVPHDEGIND